MKTKLKIKKWRIGIKMNIEKMEFVNKIKDEFGEDD